MITPALKFGAEEAAHNPTADHRLVEIDQWRADELDLAAMHFGRWWPLATFRSDAKPCPILKQQPTSGGAMGSMGR